MLRFGHAAGLDPLLQAALAYAEPERYPGLPAPSSRDLPDRPDLEFFGAGSVERGLLNPARFTAASRLDRQPRALRARSATAAICLFRATLIDVGWTLPFTWTLSGLVAAIAPERVGATGTEFKIRSRR